MQEPREHRRRNDRSPILHGSVYGGVSTLVGGLSSFASGLHGLGCKAGKSFCSNDQAELKGERIGSRVSAFHHHGLMPCIGRGVPSSACVLSLADTSTGKAFAK
ncbi:MAG: hypothetical protein ABIH21_03355 [Patescibacteria group bacterium]